MKGKTMKRIELTTSERKEKNSNTHVTNAAENGNISIKSITKTTAKETDTEQTKWLVSIRFVFNTAIIIY